MISPVKAGNYLCCLVYLLYHDVEQCSVNGVRLTCVTHRSELGIKSH